MNEQECTCVIQKSTESTYHIKYFLYKKYKLPIDHFDSLNSFL